MSIILVVLQCAYGKTPKRRRELADREAWLCGLWASHTGIRLAEMLPDLHCVEVINSTDEIGHKPSDVFLPKPEYIIRAIESIKPDVILGCGKVACAALSEIGVQFIEAPHPAWRALSKSETARIRDIIGQELAWKR